MTAKVENVFAIKTVEVEELVVQSPSQDDLSNVEPGVDSAVVMEVPVDAVSNEEVDSEEAKDGIKEFGSHGYSKAEGGEVKLLKVGLMKDVTTKESLVEFVERVEPVPETVVEKKGGMVSTWSSKEPDVPVNKLGEKICQENKTVKIEASSSDTVVGSPRRRCRPQAESCWS